MFYVLYAPHSNSNINDKIKPLNLPYGTLGEPHEDIGMEQNRQEEKGKSTMYVMLGQNIEAVQRLFEFLDLDTSNNLEFSLFEFKTFKENVFDYMITSSLDSNKEQFGYNVMIALYKLELLQNKTWHTMLSPHNVIDIV